MSRVALGLALMMAIHTAPLWAQEASASGALARSLWGTVIPVGTGLLIIRASSDGDQSTPVGPLLFFGGLVAGPALGYFYAGMPGRAWTGIGVRAVAFGGAIAIFAAELDSDESDADALVVVASVLALGSAIYDIATVPDAVRRHKQQTRESAVRILPTYSRDRHAAGIMARVGF